MEETPRAAASVSRPRQRGGAGCETTTDGGPEASGLFTRSGSGRRSSPVQSGRLSFGGSIGAKAAAAAAEVGTGNSNTTL